MRFAFLFIALFVDVASASPLDDLRDRLASGEVTKIVCFGDSITGAYYHSGGQRAWCDMLGIAIRKAVPGAEPQMINAGLSGHTTVNALARIDKDVIAHQPHAVVVMFGMNDVTRVPIDQYAANLNAIVQKCQDAQATVVLCTPNCVVENVARPNSKLKEYSAVVRKIATEQQLALADCFELYNQLREQDASSWSLLMSDDIHPNMTGHQRFAELMANTILDTDVSLTETEPPDDALHHTFERLSKGQPVKLVAMAPFDTLVPQLLKDSHFPDAEFEVTRWPSQDQSVADLANFGRRIRSLKPHLVIPAVPRAAIAEAPDTWRQDYEWMLNFSFAFGGRPWDVVPILPLTGNETTDEFSSNSAIARRIVLGKDVRFIERADSDNRSRKDMVAAWIAEQKQRWQNRTKASDE